MEAAGPISILLGPEPVPPLPNPVNPSHEFGHEQDEPTPISAGH
jgi:hypothetical protein